MGASMVINLTTGLWQVAAAVVVVVAAVEVAQCGLSPAQRFTFYDHVHTTGMDVKQPLLCTAALTLSKDMTLRDYAQGAYRMRAIGHGQRVEVLMTPEVRSLMNKSLSTVEKLQEEERPRNVAQHWLTGWLCYIGLFNAVLSVAMYLSTLPQYVTLQSLAAGEATFLAVLAQLIGYPFVVALVAVKAQLLMNIMLEALTNPGDRRTILEGTAEILQSAFKLEDTDKVRILLQFGLLAFMIQ
eukprot:g24867.t1